MGKGDDRLKHKIIFISAVVLGLLLISVHHLGYSFGDDIFRWLGIPPWTRKNNMGLHLSTILGLLLSIIGIIGTASIYRPRYPKIMSRLIIGCIAFIMIFPFITEKLFSLTYFNSTGTSSVVYSKKDSQCNYSDEGKKVKAVCKLNIYNYGKLDNVSIRPIVEQMPLKTEFEYKEIPLIPRTQRLVNEVFYGDLKEVTDFSGWSSDIDVEIEVKGVTKRFE